MEHGHWCRYAQCPEAKAWNGIVMTRQRLDTFANKDFQRGRPWWIEAAWILTQAVFFSTDLPGSIWRCWILRAFGARVSKGVVIKPRVRIKFPWRLAIGEHSWIGEAVWIDNLAEVAIGAHVCVSQGAYLCTGNHDRTRPTFDLRAQPIKVSDHAWIGAFATIAPGAELREGCIVTMSSRISGIAEIDSIMDGCPARRVGTRSTRKVEPAGDP